MRGNTQSPGIDRPAGLMRARALFINSGMLGHRAVARLLRDTALLLSGIEAQHLDLSADLTVRDRIVRRLFSLHLAPSHGRAANLDLRRWREEVNIGLLAHRRISAAEKDGPFDLLHFHTQATAYASVGRMKRTPSIVSIDSTQDLAKQEAVSALGRVSYIPNIAHDRLVFRAAGAIVATSDWTARNLRAVYPDCAAKLHVMPYPVYLDSFDPGWIDERRRIALGGEYRPRVLFMGGDFPRKGGPVLLEAWRAGGFAGRAELTLVTDWPLDVDRLPPGVSRIAGVAPYTSRWFELWRRSDVFVMASRHEAFGMVYQEAAASGIPVVATKINAIPEIVDDGVTGILVTPNDPRALMEAIGALIDTAALRQQMGYAARRRIEQRGSVLSYSVGLAAIINSVLRQHGSRVG